MREWRLTEGKILLFRQRLREEERSAGTIEKYIRDIRAFAAWVNGRLIWETSAAEWKRWLLEKGYRPGTVNSMLTAVNKLFSVLGRPECRTRTLKIQRRLFREPARELTRRDYGQLREAAQSMGRERLCLLMETICATGIRVSEVRHITVEAARSSRTEIMLKGKIRTILLPGKLCRKLLKYAKKQKIASGEIFLTRNGTGLSRKQIWAEMKALCAKAGVSPTKVFPHNLRHLFARIFYRSSRDVAKLADLLGHSSIETTRIYLISTGTEHMREIERLGLIS